MSAKVFEAKFGAKPIELTPQSRASIAGKSRGLYQENQSGSQEGTSEGNTAKKVSILLNYI